MKNQHLYNDPEYRWHNKEEMNKIMPYPTERKKFGVKVIDYQELRNINDGKIKLCKDRDFSWERLKGLTDDVPIGYDKSGKKKTFDPRARLHFESRDKGECYICHQVNHYGSNNKYSLYTYGGYSVSHLHHVVPDEDIIDRNVVTLCVHCHQVIHQILYLEGKCKYGRPL